MPKLSAHWDDHDPAWSEPNLREARFSASVERGLGILACFAAGPSVLGVAEIAEELEMARSTTHRYLITLAALGYVQQTTGRKYRLTLKVTRLGLEAINGISLHDQAHVDLEELRRSTDYTASVATLDGAEIVYADRVPSYRHRRHEQELGLGVGSRLPAYCTALGKLLLAHLPALEQQHRLAELSLVKRAPNTITSPGRFQEELDNVLDLGFAVNDEECEPGVVAIAAPVCDGSREVVAAAGLVASTRAISLPDLTDALGPHLIATADRISARLGYRRD
jgi:IclR family pca regulon transcriptional regulator